VSQDTDLLQITTRLQESGSYFSGLIFSHQQDAAIGQCVDDLALIAECCSPNELQNSVMFIPLR
jgi:hypothetical protein